MLSGEQRYGWATQLHKEWRKASRLRRGDLRQACVRQPHIWS